MDADGEHHTPKNVMITAVKQGISDKKANAVKTAIAATKAQFGIGRHALEDRLNA